MGRWERFKRSLPLILMLVLLLARAPRLLAAGANSLAARVLMPEWDRVRQEAGLPRCVEWMEVSVAEPYLALARRWDPAYAKVHLNRGRAAWLTGDCTRAWASWGRALETAPHDQIAGFWLFWASGADIGHLPQNLSVKALAHYAHRAGVLARSGRARDTAVAWYELSLALYPGRNVANQLADLHRQDGQLEKAVAVWRQVAAALPAEDAEHWWALGRAAELEQEWERAAWAYGQGGELSAKPYDFWMRQAEVFKRLQRAREEEGAYHRAIVARPGRLAPYLSLGHLWRRQGEYEGALGWYAEAERVAPGDARPPYYRAQVLYEMGDRSRAVDALTRAIALHRGQPWQWAVQLGDWRLALGDRAGALAAYHRALEWRPGEAAIRERIDQASW